MRETLACPYCGSGRVGKDSAANNMKDYALSLQKQQAEDRELIKELFDYIESNLGCVDGNALPEDETIFQPCNKCAFCKTRSRLEER